MTATWRRVGGRPRLTHHEAIQAGMLQTHQPNDPSLLLERLVCNIGEEVRARGECCGGGGVDCMGVSSSVGAGGGGGGAGVEAGVGGALELYMY